MISDEAKLCLLGSYVCLLTGDLGVCSRSTAGETPWQRINEIYH